MMPNAGSVVSVAGDVVGHEYPRRCRPYLFWGNAVAEVLATPDIEKGRNCLDAFAYARSPLADPDGLPWSIRLLNEAHSHLMRGVRGVNTQRGSVNRSQDWIGGDRPGDATFVPPPPQARPELLSALVNLQRAEMVSIL